MQQIGHGSPCPILQNSRYYFAVGMSLKETSGTGGENMPLTLGSAGADSTDVIVGGLTATWSGNTYKPTGKVSSSVAATRTGLVDASGSKMISYYENGVKIGSSATAGATVFGIRRINLGDLRAKRGCYWKGDYRSVRIYTRELTPDEITYNALVDRVRFEGVDPSTADWPEGYRHDAESGALQAKLSVAFDAQRGGVTVDGVAIGPDYESWRTLSATPETVTLVATPAEGCTFVCWSGLTAGFDVKAATVKVPVSTARALSAVFLPMATADSYVKAGLVFQLDGIDNAAQGAHEDLLSVWKDRVGSADVTLDGATVGADSVILTKALTTQMSAMTWKYPITVEAAARNTKYLSSNKLNPLLFSINNCTTLNIDFRNGNTRFEFCWPTSDDVVNRSHYRTANLGDYAVATNFHTYSATSWASSGRMYFDGRPATRDTNKINDDAKASPTGAATIGNADANTAFHSVRVYDRALTDAEAACNAAIDRMRFATVTDAASVALPDGYRLNASGKLEVRVVTMCETAFGTLDLAGQGAKTLDERWVEQGTEVSVTAAPASDAPYVWTIFDIAEKTVAGDTCTFRATAPAEVRARTTKALYVSGANGVDDARRGVSTAPYRTIGYAVAHGVEGDEIRVTGGLYREAVTNTTARRTKSYIGFSGSWNESFTVRDLRNNRTVVKPPDALVGKTPCFTIDNGTNTIAGFTLTGGSSAIQQLTPRTLTISGDPARTETYVNEREDQHSYFRQLICTNNTYGFNLSSGFPAAAVSSSIIAKNAQYAYYIATDHGTRTYFNNCTFGDNDDVAYRTWNWTSYLYGQNNVFIGNNRVIHNTKSTSYAHDFTDSLFYRNGCLFRYEAGLDKALPGCALSVNGKVYMSDPKLGADYAPSADSECRGHGADLSAHARCPVT